MERRSLVAGIAVCPPPAFVWLRGSASHPRRAEPEHACQLFYFSGWGASLLKGVFFFVRRFVFLRQFVWRALPPGHKALGLNIFSWIGTAIAFEATVYWFESNRMLNYFIYFIKAGVPPPKKKKPALSASNGGRSQSPCPPQHILKI